MPNAINNDTIFEMNNTADVDEPAMNSVDNHLMLPPAPLPVTNGGIAKVSCLNLRIGRCH